MDLQVNTQMEYRWTYRWTRDGLTYGSTDGLTGKHTNGIQTRDGLIDVLTYVLQIDYR